MYCKFCGREVDDKAELCVHCGRRIRSSIAATLSDHELTRLKPPREPKSPGLAGFLGFVLSWILMGPVGYIYLGQWNWFFITLVISVLVYILTFGVAHVLFPFVFAFHQYQMARELNEMIAPAAGAGGEGAGSPAGGAGTTHTPYSQD
jgi:hypothetical protein